MEYIQKEYLIYFYEDTSIPRHWLVDFFCKKPKFKHVGAWGYNPYSDQWFGIEYTHRGIKHQFYSKEQMETILAYFKKNKFAVLKVPVKHNWKLIWIKEHSCVSFIMRLIGYENWFIWTPYQLFCALKKKGIKSFYSNN